MSYNGQGIGSSVFGRPMRSSYDGFGYMAGHVRGKMRSALGELIYDGDKVYWLVKDASETVSSIGQKVYGSASTWPAICKYNASVGNPMDPKTPKGDCWYKVGTMLELPKLPGYPDPMDSAPKSGMATAPAGSTYVDKQGVTHTVGAGGKVTKAGMGTGTKVALAIVAAVVIGGAVVMSKKKKAAATAKANVTRKEAARVASRLADRRWGNP